MQKGLPLARKDSDAPVVDSSRADPLTEGLFVTSPTGDDSQDREPRSLKME